MLSIKLLPIIHKSENEDIVILRSEIDDTLDFLSIIIKLDPNIHVLSSLSFDDHEHIFIILLNSVSHLATTKSVLVVFNDTLDMGLT